MSSLIQNIVFLIYSIVAGTYLLQDKPSYTDKRREFLLYFSIIVVAVSGYQSSVALHSLFKHSGESGNMRRMIGKSLMVFYSSVILSYASEEECAFDAGIKDWRKKFIITTSFLMFFVNLFVIYRTIKKSEMLKKLKDKTSDRLSDIKKRIELRSSEPAPGVPLAPPAPVVPPSPQSLQLPRAQPVRPVNFLPSDRPSVPLL